MKLYSKFFFLFDMTTGKKKLGYGDDAKDALEVLAMRLTPAEMSLIIPNQYVKIAQKDLQKVVKDLG